MKSKLILLAVNLIFVVYGQAQQKSIHGYSISGKIEGLKDGSQVYLVRNNDKNSTDTIAIAKVKHGEFSFKGSIAVEGEVHFLRLDSSISKNIRTIYLDNTTFSLEGSVQNWPDGISVIGNNSTSVFDGLRKALASSKRNFTIVNDSLSLALKELSAIKRGEVKSSDSTALKDQIKRLKIKSASILDENNNIWINYIDKHPNSFYTPNAILKFAWSRHLKLEYAEKAYNKLSATVKDSYYGRKLKQSIDHDKKIENIKIGASAIDFTSKTIDGKSFSFKEFIKGNKLTLIDFWGSWCKPCRAEIPNLKKVHDAFNKQGFNVLGVALEHNLAAWKKALIEENFPWLSVSQVKGRDEEAALIYNVNGVPAAILIDENGRILAVDLPGSGIPSAGGSLRGDALYKTVEGILGRGK